MLYAVKKSFLALALTLGFVSQGFASNFWADHTSEPGTETIRDTVYYSITSAEELAWFALKTDHGTTTSEKGENINAILKNDIDLAGKVWTPICPGGGYSFFNGIFDGNGFSVKNMTISSDSIYNYYLAKHKKKDLATKYVQNAAFIGTLGSGTVKNLTLKDISFSITNSTSGSSQISVGAVVGWKSTKGNGNGVIDFCSASGTINTSGKTQGVGGLVGNAHSSTIKNSISYVNIIASGENAHVGGIVGLTKNNEVKIESCVYAGEQLVSSGTGSSVGAVVGNVVSGSVKPTNTYYDNGNTDIPAVGNKTVTGATDTDNLNSEDVVCVLNGGTWDSTNAVCNNDTSSYWSVGLSGLSLNGSDGYEITFDANGGSFASGAKTTKILASGETITADEIGTPTLENKKFAGWATTANAAEPVDNLGVADASKKLYAVWYDYYTVFFKTGSETSFTDATFPDGEKIHSIRVAKHGAVAIEGFSVPAFYENSDNVKYYFTGWAFESKSFEANYEIKSTDTLSLTDKENLDITRDTVLYAVWTKAKTFSVTFDATDHGVTNVKFVRVVNEGDAVSEPNPDDIITEPGYRLVGWFTDENCTEGLRYNFATPLTDTLTLFAKWEVVDYTISYEMNGGTNADGNPTTYNINSDDIVFANPTKTGASFDGWFYNYENGEFSNRATQISKGSSFGDKTLYAKWTPLKYTIHYLSGSTIAKTISSDEKEYGVNIQLKGVVEEFAHKGCVQDGWSIEDLGNKVYDVGATYDGNADLMLYPHWTCTSFDITYQMFGVDAVNYFKPGTDTVHNPMQYTGPTVLTLKNAYDAQNPQRFFMDNWYKDQKFKTIIRDISDITAPITVYAKWYNKITYKPGARLMAVNNKLSDKVDKKYFDSTYTLRSSVDNFVLAGYTLDGWTTTDNGEKTYELDVEYSVNENLTLYPHWVENRDSTKSGAVTIYTYATDDRKEAVINGTYGGGDVANPDEADAVEIATDVVVNSVVLNRTFNVNKVATLYLPFEIDTANINGATIYKFKTVVKSEEDGRWKFKVTKAAKVLPNTPYVALPSASQVTFDIPESVTLNTTTAGEEAASGAWEFRGVYTYTVFTADPENPVYFFADQVRDGAKLGEFVITGTGAWLNPMRAYLIYHKGGLAKSARGNLGSNIMLPDELDIVVEDENGIVVETGRLNTVTGEVRMDRWFDLKGRKLNSKPAVKGTYYKNGKRVIIK